MPRLLLILLGSIWLQVAYSNRCATPAASVSWSKNLYKQALPCQQTVSNGITTVYYATYRPAEDSLMYAKVKRKAKWAKWLGIGSLASLLLPVIGVLAIPAAVISLIMAGQVKRDTDDRKLLDDAKTGKIFSFITIGLIVVVIIAVLAIVALFIGGSR